MINDLVGEFFGFNQIIKDKNTIISAQATQIVTLNGKIVDLNTLIETTKSQDKKLILDLEDQIDSLERLYGEEEMEKFWNNRYPKINKNYQRTEKTGNYSIDVRNFFAPYDANVPKVLGATNDDKAFNAQKLVRERVTYVPDKTRIGIEEYWAYWYETWERKAGDCEDGAILMANILLASGVPYWRIRLNAGSVNGGGHAYLTYCRETDNQFVVLDWCYWPNNLPIAQRKLHKDEQNYDDEEKNFYIWFSWNLKYCFGKMQTMSQTPEYLK